MAELKTKQTDESVERFIDNIKDKRNKEDCLTLIKLMKSVTKSPPKMWGSAIVGFGSYRYVYDSGRENDWFIMGFSPRKQNLTLYLMGGLEMQQDLLTKLGKYKIGKSCLYFKSLEGVDQRVLRSMMEKTAKKLKA